MSAPLPEPRLARAAALVADATRSRMLASLLDGGWASAGELAKTASVSAATASAHLALLRDAQFVAVEQRGRHRFYRLFDAEVAHLLEALALVAERGEHDKSWARPERQALREARCCYGHLAGRLGVRLYESICNCQGLLLAEDGLQLTDAGRLWLRERLDFTPQPPSGRRRYAYACLDWSERRDHLAGQLADEIHAHLLGKDWLRRGEGRVLQITPSGGVALGSLGR